MDYKKLSKDEVLDLFEEKDLKLLASLVSCNIEEHKNKMDELYKEEYEE